MNRRMLNESVIQNRSPYTTCVKVKCQIVSDLKFQKFMLSKRCEPSLNQLLLTPNEFLNLNEVITKCIFALEFQLTVWFFHKMQNKHLTWQSSLV